MSTTATMPKIVMARDDLIAALEARRPWVQRLDSEAEKKHRAAERAALAEFKAMCKDAAKWSYDDLKRHDFRVELRYARRPDCPKKLETTLDRAVSTLKLTQRKTITVTDSNENSRIFFLLTHDETAKPDVCS